MRTQNIILRFLKEAHIRLGHLPRHPQAHLYPYEVVAIGQLYALKGGSFSAFYRWLVGDWSELFTGPIPERTRLIRLLERHHEDALRFLARPEGELVCDSYGLEMVHPWRSDRRRMYETQRQERGLPVAPVNTIARKGISNHRWIVGLKLNILIRLDGRIVDFGWATANMHDNCFNPLTQKYPHSTILADRGYAQATGLPSNLQLCRRGERNERMVVERTFSLLTTVAHTKHLYQRAERHITAHFAYLAAMFNTVIRWTRRRVSLAQFSL